MSGRFAADWLALREPHDAAARDRGLMRRFAAALPARPRILDLGAGTGSLFRALAPMIARDQDWTLVDGDPALLAAIPATIAAWARARRGAVFFARQPEMGVITCCGTWTITRRRADLTDSAGLTDGFDGIACSAMLDLVSARWLARLIGRLEVPFYAALTVDGADAWRPAHPLDRAVRQAFRRDQRRDKGFGHALGPAAPAVLHRMLTDRGFVVREARSPWRLRRGNGAMLEALTAGHAAVAGQRLNDWAAARRREQARLVVTIGHRDMLALPDPKGRT